MQCRVERALADCQDVFGGPLDPASDVVAVGATMTERLKDQEVQSAPQDVGRDRLGVCFHRLSRGGYSSSHRKAKGLTSAAKASVELRGDAYHACEVLREGEDLVTSGHECLPINGIWIGDEGGIPSRRTRSPQRFGPDRNRQKPPDPLEAWFLHAEDTDAVLAWRASIQRTAGKSNSSEIGSNLIDN
jgi:hypothetical protein